MSDHPAPDLASSQAFCRAVARREAKNFYPSFLLLPTDRRRSMCALYGFLRHTDDLADGPGDPAGKAAALVGWRRGLDAAYESGPAEADRAHPWPGWPALVEASRRHGLPRAHLHEVIDGVEMDLHPRPFATFADLHGYCYRVASAVGLSCLHVWGYRSDGGRAERLAEDCGIALQLTNILRDVGEDARTGRVYLPADDRARFGVGPADLEADRVGPALRELLAFEARRAAEYYDRARPLAELVDPVGRPVLGAIVGIYRALLDEIVRRDFEVLAARVAVPGWRKAAIALGALPSRFRPRSGPRDAVARAEESVTC